MVRPTRCAAWNMVGAFISVSVSPVFGFSMPSLRMLDDRLAEREVAGGGERHDAFAGTA